MNRLEQIAAQIEQQNTPPVHLWKPDHNGEIDIEIDAAGRWYHEGGEIKRAELVRLFASILWCEEGQHYLVTPVEKLKIRVADVPFIVQQAELAESVWALTINTGQTVLVGEDHPVELRSFQDQDLPYVRIRYDLWARLSRGVYYQWVDEALGLDESESPILRSGDYIIELA